MQNPIMLNLSDIIAEFHKVVTFLI